VIIINHQWSWWPICSGFHSTRNRHQILLLVTQDTLWPGISTWYHSTIIKHQIIMVVKQNPFWSWSYPGHHFTTINSHAKMRIINLQLSRCLIFFGSHSVNQADHYENYQLEIVIELCPNYQSITTANERVISPHAVEGFRARNTADHLDNY